MATWVDEFGIEHWMPDVTDPNNPMNIPEYSTLEADAAISPSAYSYLYPTDPTSGQGWFDKALSSINTTFGTTLTPTQATSFLSAAGGTGASLYGAQLQAEANKNALLEQARQFNMTQQNLSPYLKTGTSALYNLEQLAQQPLPTYNAPTAPTAQQMQPFSYDPNAYFSNPAYQAMLRSGTEAIDASAAARGNFGSGNQAAELQKLGMSLGAQYQNQAYQQQLGTHQQAIQDIMNKYGIDVNAATQMYNSQFQNALTNRNLYQSMAGLGQTTGTQLGQLGQYSAATGGQFGANAASAQASGLSGAAQGFGQMTNALIP